MVEPTLEKKLPLKLAPSAFIKRRHIENESGLSACLKLRPKPEFSKCRHSRKIF